MKMISNLEIFFNFLANRFVLTDYILAYTKRYDVRTHPFYLKVNSKANKNPKRLFSDILGSGHNFKDLEKKWIEYVDASINYKPKKGDDIYCAYFDEKECELVSWIDVFASGTKENYVNKWGRTHDEQTFVCKIENNINKND